MSHELADQNPPHGISAVLQPGHDLDGAALDLAAVLEGLVGKHFEIILVAPDDLTQRVAELSVRAPGLPVRSVAGSSLADGCDAASFELIFTAARDGQFDVRELNHLLEAIEAGADVAAGYRPRRTDVFVRRLQRWGWKVDVDCAYALIRQRVWKRLKREGRVTACCAELLNSVRQLGYTVREVPVRHRRPAIGAPVSTWRAA